MPVTKPIIAPTAEKAMVTDVFIFLGVELNMVVATCFVNWRQIQFR